MSETPTAARSCECGWSISVSEPDADREAERALANHTCR